MDNNCIFTVVPSKWLRHYEYFLLACTLIFLLYLIYLITPTLFNSLKLAYTSNVWPISDLLLLLFFVLLISFLFVRIKFFLLALPLYKTNIEFFNDSIVFTKKSFKYKVSKPDIKYIFAWKRKTSIIFQNEQLYYFVFSESIYGSKQLNCINGYFKTSNVYFNDKKQIKKIMKDNNLQKSRNYLPCFRRWI
ncbi:MAG: hypothetical protein BWY69_01836 [Planctomycetes bacterium ADurb.Bin401]|nr:MAG: hypothetical protein BWY69_01836 [Planctomycetes bacterium ADurb.Bin401]